MTLVSRITDLAMAVQAKLNAMSPRLIPAGGTAGQVLAKTSTADHAVSWTTPTGGAGAAPGGDSGSIQYRDGDGFTGDPSVIIRPDIDGIQINGIVMRNMTIGQHNLLTATGAYELGSPIPLASHPGFISTREWLPITGTTTYTKAMTVATTGTATAQAISNSRWLAEPALNYVSAATAGSQATWVNSNPVVRSATANTGGFFVTIRMSVKGYAAGKRWFVGLSGDSAAPGNVEPSSLTNIFGIGVDSTDSTVQVMWRGASGASTKQNTGLPADLSGENVTFCFKCANGSPVITSGFLLGGYGYGGTAYDLPAGLVYPKAWVGNGAVASTITLSMNRAYVEYG